MASTAATFSARASSKTRPFIYWCRVCDKEFGSETDHYSLTCSEGMKNPELFKFSALRRLRREKNLNC